MKEERVKYYLEIARAIAQGSKCSRRKFGAILVKKDTIISGGYNGSVRGSLNCGLDVPCLKDLVGEESYKSYQFCPAVHAEQNAIINAGRERAYGSTLFLNSSEDGKCERPCRMCRRACIQAGVYDCYYKDKENKIHHELVEDWIQLENEWMEEILKTKGGKALPQGDQGE